MWTFARGRHLAAGVRVDAFFVHDAWTEEIEQTNPRGKVVGTRAEDRTSWGPGADAALEGSWSPGGPGFAFFAAVTGEAASRATAGFRANASDVWVSAESGARFSF